MYRSCDQVIDFGIMKLLLLFYMLCRAFVWFSCWASAHVCYMCREGKGKDGALSWRACGAVCTWTAGLLDAVIGSAGVYLVFSWCSRVCDQYFY